MLYLYNTPGMNIWVVRPFIRPLLRDQGTESVKWGNALRVVLRERFSEHGSNIWMDLLPDYQFTSWLHRASNNVETFLLPTDAHNVKKHRVIKTF